MIGIGDGSSKTTYPYIENDSHPWCQPTSGLPQDQAKEENQDRMTQWEEIVLWMEDLSLSLTLLLLSYVILSCVFICKMGVVRIRQ